MSHSKVVKLPIKIRIVILFSKKYAVLSMVFYNKKKTNQSAYIIINIEKSVDPEQFKSPLPLQQ